MGKDGRAASKKFDLFVTVIVRVAAIFSFEVPAGGKPADHYSIGSNVFCRVDFAGLPAENCTCWPNLSALGVSPRFCVVSYIFPPR